MIALKSAERRYGASIAVYPTTLEFERGKTTALIGPSGCGKSTLLRMIIGLIAPSSGTLEVDGTPVNTFTSQQLRRRMGYVIQDGGLFPHLTALRNITLMAQHVGTDPAKVSSRVAELCTLTHFPQEALGRFPVELSGGQRQRVSLMRGLMLDPDILLLDEPLGALDPLVRSALQKDLRSVFEALGKTVVLVTHDMAEAGYLGHRLVLMREGRVVQSGSLEDFQKRPSDAFVTEFLTAQRSLVML